MKNKIYLFAVFIVMISCSKKDDQILPETQEPGKKIQYSHDFFQEKIDNVDNPMVYSVNIIADLDKSKKSTKKVESVGFSSFAFTYSDYDYADYRYLYQELPGQGYAYWADRPVIDLNKGAGGAFIYLYYSPTYYFGINEFWVTIGDGTSDQYSCRVLRSLNGIYNEPADLNRGAGGNFIYAHARYNSSPYLRQITGIGVIAGNSSTIKAPPGWDKINVDLNAGAGGDWIFFIIKR
ncbi:MAG: hypothetical protein EHM93_03445 [Bacteroidales bacterium]|nr:MAG: hypothetical protein EHM93_03445 [Bacteroidales bacterium]